MPAARGHWTRLYVHGEQLVQRLDSELRVWDLGAMKRAHTIATAYRAACFLPDGRLAALRELPSSPYPELHLVDAQGGVDVRTGALLSTDSHTHLLAGASADEVYVTEHGKLLHHCDLGGKHFRIDDTSETTDGDSLVSLPDGRLVALRYSALAVIARGKPAVELAAPAHPVLLVPAAAPRVWMTLLEPDAWGAQVLVLARVTDALAADARIDVSPGRIFDLAAAGDTVAMLVDTRDKADWKRSVVVLAADGKERWRADAPAHARALLAMSSQRVVMSLNDGSLLAWDAATGSPVKIRD